jgi:adenylate cyclase
MRHLPWLTRKWLLMLVLLAACLGSVVDSIFGNQIDYWIHDSAVVFQARTAWKHTAIVVLDDAIPIQVSRKQALPLFAKAAERLVAAGVKGIFLDANLPKEIEGIMPYAQCIEQNGEVRWSMPTCLMTNNQCQIRNSSVGNAPLKMPGAVFPLFRVAPYIAGQENLPDFLLYGDDAEAFIPKTGLVALDRLISKNSAIARWMDLTDTHSAVTLAKFIAPEQVAYTLNHESHELCDHNLPCQRIRFSQPSYSIELSQTKPIIPVSNLAACNDDKALQVAAMLKNRVVILQLTTPSEASDVIITPTTTAFLSAHLLMPGAQFLADATETLLANDYPRAPSLCMKLLVFFAAASVGIYASVYLKQPSWLWLIGICLLSIMSALCFLSPITQLWPVTATLLTFIAASLQGIALHLLIGFKEGDLIAQYMPRQVHKLLFSLKANKSFHNQRYQAIVLMSDLTGYTAVTGIVKEPAHILTLMNDYLNDTAYVLQEKYEGWLETYIGDMVCYYWPFKEKNKTQAYQNAVMGAVALSLLQKDFFTALPARYQNKFDGTTLQNIKQVINAGIGLSSGTVVMGNLGPKRGVRKFGILGDPMNLTARVESLTRYFNTEIIMTADFLNTTKALGYPSRRLGYFCVKGRTQPEMLYALGSPDDYRFCSNLIDAWERWLSAMEQETSTIPFCPDVFQQDADTLHKWKRLGFLYLGIWFLEEK